MSVGSPYLFRLYIAITNDNTKLGIRHIIVNHAIIASFHGEIFDTTFNVYTLIVCLKDFET